MSQNTNRALIVILIVTTVACSGVMVSGCSRTESQERPNFVFILTDDHRFDAMGCSGDPRLQTPNLDRLAAEGVRFTNAFVTTSLCSPSRASFLTGCYAHSHGVVANEIMDPDRSLATFPDLLQQAGYETAFVGKWHMLRRATPRQGFDHWVSFNGQGEYYRNTLNVDGEWVLTHNYITDELTEYAQRFIEKEHDRPFLLIVSHKAVHAPNGPAPRHMNNYADLEFKARDSRWDNLTNKPIFGGRRQHMNPEEEIKNYHRCILAVDESIGRIMDVLLEQNILEHTVVIYAGDNGYLHGEHVGLWDKRLAYEPSIRIPLLMRYPALVNPGTRCEALVLNIDLAPTVLQLAGVPRPDFMEGQSWLGVLSGQPGRNAFLYEYFKELGEVPTIVALRTKEWKYVTYPLNPDLPSELYHLKYDPEELHNRIAESAYENIINQLALDLESLKQETDFKFPSAEQ